MKTRQPKHYVNIFLWFVICLLAGCKQEDNFSPIYEVPEDIQPIVETFISEAESRGLTLEINNLIIAYDEELDGISCGTCNSLEIERDIQKTILIKPGLAVCYDSHEEFETLIFHEMGHCVLGRPHDDSLLPNGDPKSLMMTNDRRMYSACTYVFGNASDCNNLHKREYYLDELFNEDTETPEWALEE